MLIDKIQDIKIKLLYGKIDYDTAKFESEPIIKEMNKKSQEIAMRHKQKFQKINFTQLMR